MSFAKTYDPEQTKKYGTNRHWLPGKVGESIVLRLLPGFSADDSISPSSKKPYAYYKLHKVEILSVGYELPLARRIVSLDQFTSKKERDSRKKIVDTKLTVENVKDIEVRRQVARQIEDLKAICPLQALSKQIELNYFTLKADGAPQEVVNVAWRKFMDSMGKGLYFFNAVDKNGNHGVFEINSTIYKKIKDIVTPKAIEEGLSVYSTDENGIWIKFSRISKGEKDNFSVEINQNIEEIEGRKVKISDTTPLSNAVLENLDKAGVDLDHFYDNSMVTREQAMQIFLGEAIQLNKNFTKLPSNATKNTQKSPIPTTPSIASVETGSGEEGDDFGEEMSVEEAMGL